MASPISAIAEHSLMNRWRLWTCLLLLAGFLPILSWHVAGLLVRPHYQFIVFIPLAWWMIWQMWSTGDALLEVAPRISRWRWAVAIASFILGFACLGFAIWRWSPWFAAVGALIASFGLVLVSSGERVTSSRWFGIWLSCWILLPLPFGLDEDLIVQLRTFTTRMSSSVMDALGLLHHSYANVIELPSRSLFIADACSGIHSLYVLIAVAFFIAILLKRSVIHTGLLLLSTFGLVLVENVTRIVVVGLALRRGHDWSEGTSHTVLGAVLFAFSALLVLSADQFFLFLLPDREPRDFTSSTGQASRGRGEVESASEATGQNEPRQRAAWLVALACLFPPMALAQWVRAPEVPKLTNPFVSELALPSLTADAMPEEILGFVRFDHDTLTRVPGDPFGKASQRWMYRKGSATLNISLDYPYEGVKDMCPCYEATGWQIGDRELISPNQGAAPYGQAALYRELFGHGVVMFSSFDLQGQTKALIKELSKPSAKGQMLDRLRGPDEQVKLESGNPPYIQVQLFARDHRPFEDAELEELRQIYQDARTQLMAKALAEAKK